jgi:hypothetical protein
VENLTGIYFFFVVINLKVVRISIVILIQRDYLFSRS